jgi:hypothetical protein
MAKSAENDIEKRSVKRLPINVDGAIAALLCEMDFLLSWPMPSSLWIESQVLSPMSTRNRLR